ncbi:MAG: hypothetical protein KC656_01995 [Myxococcales bacterium]|nr:hypothetical protein [Myxococcales bacterium]
MAGRYANDDFNEEELDKARQRLEAFEAERRGKDRMARLRYNNPRHPALLGMSFTLFSGAAMVVLAVAMAVAPLASDDIARTFAQIPGVGLVPFALVMLAICSAMLYGVLYGVALGQGGSAPFLPADLKEQNRLRSDVQRLTVAKDVQKRLTGTPAPTRERRY